jgi:Na+/H+ antiporter NhaC
MESIPWPFQICIIAAIIGNILWYRIKFINKSKGYKMNLFTHSGDFKHFKEIIRNEENIDAKKKYELILKSTYACLAVLTLSFIGTVVLTMSQKP